MQLDNETIHLAELDGRTIDHVVTGVTPDGQRFIDIILDEGWVATITLGVTNE
jgi:hypothetical protein